MLNDDKVNKITASRLIDEGKIYGLVGIMQLKGEEFLCVIKEVSEAARLTLPH